MNKFVIVNCKRARRDVDIKFSGNSKTSIIIAYSPATNVPTSDKETASVREELRKAFDNNTQYNILTILGDMNAKISSSYVKFT